MNRNFVQVLEQTVQDAKDSGKMDQADDVIPTKRRKNTRKGKTIFGETAGRPGIMRKPTMNLRHSKKTRLPSIHAASTAVSKVRERTQIELDRRLEAILNTKNKLKSKADQLATELNAVRNEQNHVSQERDRLAALWEICRQQLDVERTVGVDIQTEVQRMKSKQAEQIKNLQQRIRYLILNSKIQRVASTQTEVTPSAQGRHSVECQTVQEITRERAAQMLRNSDKMLTALISELEKEKLNAQSDLKYAIVQLEQKMKEENENQMRRFREEKQRQLEEISSLHAEQLKTLEDEENDRRMRDREDMQTLQNKILLLDTDNETQKLKIEDLEIKLEELTLQNHHYESENRQIRKDLGVLRDYKSQYQRDIKSVDFMKKEVQKYKDINEILMGEFKKIEEERDQLVYNFEKNIDRLGRFNRSKKDGLHSKISAVEREFEEKFK